MEIICINDKFSNDQLRYWKEYRVVHPIQDKLYTIRDVIINSIGKTGLLLEEIINPKIPIDHPLLGKVNMEPNFDINRFSNLDQTQLNLTEINQNLKKYDTQNTKSYRHIS